MNQVAQGMKSKKFHLSFAKKNYLLVAPNKNNGIQEVISIKPISAEVIYETRRFLGEPFKLKVVDQKEFDKLLIQEYEADSSLASQMVDEIGEDMDLASTAEALSKSDDLLDSHDDAPVIKLVNALLSQAIKEGASDVHIEVFETNLVVRFRVDGLLRQVLQPPKAIAPLLISRLKVMAKLDIAEKRIPQDGRITLKMGGRTIDVRVSSIPSSHGERIVLRLLIKSTGPKELSQLGLINSAEHILRQLLNKPHGILLVTGPTGAGKSTTLYSCLSTLDTLSKNILTIEDPVEYDIPGVGQTQVHNKVGMTFAKGLRAILRQDPDIVMIGEIRDLETAEIAVQASLTGHLVLSTLHTNTAIGAITRMQDMGVEKFLLASSVIGVAAQRLVRVLCHHCKRQVTMTDHMKQQLSLGKGDYTCYEPVGCSQCNQLGYVGRRGIYEIIACDYDLRKLIHDGSSEQLIENYVREHYPSIRDDGVRLILAGETSIEEVLRVTIEE